MILMHKGLKDMFLKATDVILLGHALKRVASKFCQHARSSSKGFVGSTEKSYPGPAVNHTTSLFFFSLILL